MDKKRFISILKSIVGIGIIMMGCFVSSQIYAYFTDADFATNEVIIGGSNIQIIEKFEPPKEMVPGISFEKDVKIKNLGPSNCYVRVKAVFSDSDIGQYCEIDWNQKNWIYSEVDGYYYYEEVILKGECSTSLFTTVQILDTAPENAMKDFDMIIYAESYQSENFDTYVDAWEHYQMNKPKE